MSAPSIAPCPALPPRSISFSIGSSPAGPRGVKWFQLKLILIGHQCPLTVSAPVARVFCRLYMCVCVVLDDVAELFMVHLV